MLFLFMDDNIQIVSKVSEDYCIIFVFTPFVSYNMAVTVSLNKLLYKLEILLT